MIWDIDPVIIQLGAIQLRYYGIMFALGIFLAYYTARQLYKVRGIDEKHLDGMLLYIVISMVVGAHLAHLIFYEPSSFIDNPIRILQVGNGLASHGGFVGAVLGHWLYVKRHKQSFYELIDPVVPGAGLLALTIRIGNFFNSEIVGSVTNVPWAVQFVRYDEEFRHPSQLYESFTGLILFLVFFYLYKKEGKTRVPGYFFYWFIIAYFTSRFIIEFWKEKQSELEGAASLITMGQWLSVPMVLFAIYMLYFSKRPMAKR